MRCLTRHLLLCLLLIDFPLAAQQSASVFPEASFSYRNVGPVRGGRVTTVTSHAQHPGRFYLGSTGGGVWMSDNYGTSWRNISDSYFSTGSIGCISIAPSNPDIIYVGTGSDGLRSNVILGRGVYKSVDAGKTWTDLGLHRGGQIGSIVVHPSNPQVLMVAAIGNPFKASKERGIYRSRDGGLSWQQTLFISEKTGAVDLEFSPDNPMIVYASLWQARRKPWTIISGGYEGGLYRSTDGGLTWDRLTKGLPQGLIGKSDLAVSQADPSRVWALIEAPSQLGGVYRSDDYGQSFDLISTKGELLDRPFYFCNIDVNPNDADAIYVGSTRLWHSPDAGHHWQALSTPHADHHGMWINPVDTAVRILATDGGATVTRDAGRHWSSIDNQPTAELYQVALDDRYPFWMYAGQQDHSTVAVPSLPTSYHMHLPWETVGGCETGPAIPKPGNPNIIYANCKGRFGVYDRRTGQEKQYYIGATNMYGHNPKDLTFRFQRVAPIHVSPHSPDVIYHCSQYVHRTMDEGETWEIISPDLTANTQETQLISGGPITRDITGEEFFSTIYAIEESPVSEGVIWVGANDGPIHLSKDGGQTWIDVTPAALPPYGRVQTIEASSHDPAVAYVAVYRYLLGDFQPYIYQTQNFGSSWSLLTTGNNGIPVDHPTRVIREDPQREELLYAGTEFGMFVSFNGGGQWFPFQHNLPTTPITDIVIRDHSLIVSTMGRGFWIMDDISPLQQWHQGLENTTYIFTPKKTYRHRYRASKADAVPQYPDMVMKIHFYLDKVAPNRSTLRIINEDREIVADMEPGASSLVNHGKHYDGPRNYLHPGLHTVHWNLRHADNRTSGGKTIKGPLVKPGNYRLELHIGDHKYASTAQVLADPRILQTGITLDDLMQQEELSLQIQELRLRAETLVEKLTKRADGHPDAAETAHTGIWSQLVTAEGRYQKPMLLDQLLYLEKMMDRADQRPGRDAYQQFATLREKLVELELMANLSPATD